MKFVIPNFFTLSNLILGFICIINIFNNPTNSTVLYLFYLCLILDFLDGFFARKFNVVSEFGKQLDSFADFVSFCILPSLVLYFYLGNTAENIIVKYLPLLIIIFSALRLAKFNITENNNNYFTGFPTPANGLFFMSLVNYQGTFDFFKDDLSIAIFIILFSILLVSKIKFISLKFSGFNFNNNIERYLLILLSTSMLIIYGHSIIFIIILLYILLSVIKSIFFHQFFK
ncbi:MAG: CDP-diacylglycerol--serine O-phosphatidyltransferase [Bacteroidota bacterium]|nr:CDP-diacylglycerol--serine O-phosphatidyltransferase [Bacteroidota bacterium]